MKEKLYFLTLTAVCILAIASIYIGLLFFKKHVVFRSQRIFLSFIVVHCLFAYFYGSDESLFVSIGVPFSLFYAPLFYSNLQALIQGDEYKLRQTFVHYILGFIFLLIFAVLYFNDNYLNPLIAKFYLVVLYAMTCIQLVFYAVITYLKFNLVAKDRNLIAFMNQSITIMILGVLLFFGVILRDQSVNVTYANSFIAFFLMLLIVIAIFILNLSVVMKKLTFYKTNSKVDYFNNDNNDIKSTEKYYKSKLSEAAIEQDVNILKGLLESGVFLNPDLTLDTLARKMNVSSHHLSQIFTVGLDSNFNKTINSYRIQNALELLKDSNNKSTIEEIGLDSGFNSRASFYRAFNATFNMTPSDYRKNMETNFE